MPYLITLSLSPSDATLEFVKNLPWTNALAIDENYGLMLISPKRNLYTIRVTGELAASELLEQYPDLIKGVHSDVHIDTFSEQARDETGTSPDHLSSR